MPNHHTHPTDPIRDKKTNTFDTSMASPSRPHNFAARVSHRYIITVAEFGRSRRPPSLGAPTMEFGRSRRVWALPQETAMKSAYRSRFEFGRSRQKQQESALLGGDDMYLHAYICEWVLSVLSDTHGFMLSLGLGHSDSIEQTGVLA